MRVAAALVVVLASLVAVPAALADGDPASDFLLTQQIYLPYDAKLPKASQEQLAAVVAAANRAGYKIRVALIASSYDLGSITSLWRRPRTYARFLGTELHYVYNQRLLVVMPNGFGFNRPKHNPAREYAVLAKIPIGAGIDGLASAAQTAVTRLATAEGVKVVPVPVAAPANHTTRDRAIIVVVALAAIALALLARVALRRRRAAS